MAKRNKPWFRRFATWLDNIVGPGRSFITDVRGEEPRAHPDRVFLGFRTINVDLEDLGDFDFILVYLRDTTKDIVRKMEKANIITFSKVEKIEEEKHDRFTERYPG